MYETFYGFRERPFSLQPDPGFLYLGKRHRMALTMLQYALESQAAIAMLTGDIGAGKTTLLRHLLNQLDHGVTVGLVSNTHKAFGELLHWVLLAFGLEHQHKNKAELYQTLVDFLIERYAKGQHTILIIDEAQNLSPATLEELRVITNVNADKDQILQLMLSGQPELRNTLRRADLEQFTQRISVDFHLGPLDETETHAYICHRLRIAGGDPETFSPEARTFVHHQCDGIPRLVNTLCDTALVYGFAEQSRRIEAALVRDIVEERRREGLFGAGARKPQRELNLIERAVRASNKSP